MKTNQQGAIPPKQEAQPKEESKWNTGIPKENGWYTVEVQGCDLPDERFVSTDEFINGYWQNYAQFVNRWKDNICKEEQQPLPMEEGKMELERLLSNYMLYDIENECEIPLTDSSLNIRIVGGEITEVFYVGTIWREGGGETYEEDRWDLIENFQLKRKTV